LFDWNGVRLRQIGIVASPSEENLAQCILHEGEERRVTTETLVLIDNRNGNKILAVCRRGMGSNDALKTDYYNPGVAYAKMGKGASTAKEFYGFSLVVIGDVTDGVIKQNRVIIAPASPVYIFPEDFNPMRLLSKSNHTLGYYATGTPLWRVPLLTEYISHHIGVFGITGSGKSFLTRYQLIPLLKNAGYDVLIFDWKGSDYAPYHENVINMGDIQLDEQAIYSYLAEKLNRFGGGNMGNTLLGYLEEAIASGGWICDTPAETKERLLAQLRELIRSDNQEKGGGVDRWGQRYLRRLERYFSMVEEEDFRAIIGQMTPADIYRMLKEKHLLVVDLSLGSKEQKLSVFLSIIRFLKRMMEEKNELNVALVIDEAPQYCPWQPRGVEEETTREIIGSAALGRSYRLSLVLISQGIAGEIGINAAVRRNLNTMFIGRIHPLDAPEAEKFFATAAVDPSTLLRLPEGQFYLIGKMNPSPVPLLITFEIPEEERVVGKR
jgi:hypothetical protein